MEMDSMKDMVIQASTTFYNTQDREQRKSAEEWLNNFKKSIHAWYITDQILHTEKNEQVLFFAAQTIRSKIQHSFYELPLDSHESLRSSLLEHLENLSSCNLNTVQTQIYIALADLIMFMCSWQNPVYDLIQRFDKSPDKFKAFVEFLTILPEEIHNKRLKLGSNRRDQIKNKFSEDVTHLINYLQSNLTQCVNDQNKIRSIYKCFSSWIENNLLDTNQILNTNLYMQLFHFLYDQNINTQLHETLTQCLVSMLQLYKGTQIFIDEQPLIISLKENILKLTDAYKSAEQLQQNEKCVDFCLIFTELCSSLVYHLVNEPNTIFGDYNCLNLLLLPALHSDYEVFQKSFIFWFNISEEIYSNSNSESICKIFRPYVEHLIQCICKHCRLPSDHVGIPPCKTSEFGEFRIKASDLLSDVVFIIDPDHCFENLYNVLHASNSTWVEIEAALFVMCTIAKSISSDERKSVAQVVEALINLTHHIHISVRYTGIRLIGELCDWLNKNSEYIDNCLNFLFSGFMDPSLCQIAANTILNICTHCQNYMLNHLDVLFSIIISAENINVPSEASVGLLKGTVVILCNLQNDRITEALLKLCTIQIEGLQKVMDGKIREGSKALPMFWLDRLTAIFRTIKINVNQNNSNPCQPVVELMWPTLSMCCQKYQNDYKVAESCCRTLRFALRCTEKHARNILEPLVNSIVALYQTNHHSCYLYLGSILIDIFGSEHDFKLGLTQMMQAFTAEAFGYILRNCKSVDNISELRKYPDTIDDFFRLSMRFLQRCPKEFIENSIFIPIINLAVNALTLDHRDAHCSITKFLSEFVSVSNNASARGVDSAANKLLINQLVSEMSAKIIENSIHGIINMSTRDTKDGIADLLTELLFANRKQCDLILLNTLRSLVKFSPDGTEIVSDKQLMDIYSKIIRADTSSDIEYALIELEQIFQ